MAFPDTITVPATNGDDVAIPDVERFCRHLQDFHRTGTSLHTESGYGFQVDDDFRKIVQDQVPDEKLF